MQRRRQELVVHTILPILVGGTMYILWRSTDLRIFSWLDWLKLLPLAIQARHSAGDIGSVLPSWVLFSLPAALWSYSVVSWIGVVWSAFSVTEKWTALARQNAIDN